MPADQPLLARQLCFWHGRDTEGQAHYEVFAGQTTYTDDDWENLLIDSERATWMERAKRVLDYVEKRVTMVAVIMLNDSPQFVTSLDKAESKKRELAAEYERKNPHQGTTRYWHIREVSSDYVDIATK